MSRANDGRSDMTALLLDDATTEGLLAGEPVDLRFAALESVIMAMREAVPVDAPEPTDELAALFASPQALAEAVAAMTTDVVETGCADRAEATPKVATRSMRSRASRAARAAGGLGLAAKIALGAGAAAAAVGGAGAAGVLPTPIQDVVAEVTHLGDSPNGPTPPAHPGQSDAGRGSGSSGTDRDGVTPSAVPSTTAGSSSAGDAVGSAPSDPPESELPGNGNANGAANGNAGGNGNGVANGPDGNSAGENGNAGGNGNGNAGGNGNGLANGPDGNSAGGNGNPNGATNPDANDNAGGADGVGRGQSD